MGVVYVDVCLCGVCSDCYWEVWGFYCVLGFFSWFSLSVCGSLCCDDVD